MINPFKKKEPEHKWRMVEEPKQIEEDYPKPEIKEPMPQSYKEVYKSIPQYTEPQKIESNKNVIVDEFGNVLEWVDDEPEQEEQPKELDSNAMPKCTTYTNNLNEEPITNQPLNYNNNLNEDSKVSKSQIPTYTNNLNEESQKQQEPLLQQQQEPQVNLSSPKYDEEPSQQLNFVVSDNPKTFTAKKRFEVRLTQPEKDYVFSQGMAGAEYVRHLILVDMKRDREWEARNKNPL